MTEPTPEIQPATVKADTTETTTARNAAASSTPSRSAAKPPKEKKRSALGIAFVLVLLIAAALAAVLWFVQKKHTESHAQLVGQLSTNQQAATKAGQQAQQALLLAQSQTQHIASLQASLDDAAQQLQGLEQALQMLTDSGSDLVLINDVDHLAAVAQQQLLLSGNVANAIIALETAQSQLARANRTSLAPLQQAINGDLDHLRAASTVDVAQLSARLDELNQLISHAPLWVPDDAAPKADSRLSQGEKTAPVAPSVIAIDPNAPWWKQGLDRADNWSRSAWGSIRQDLGDLISVRRVQDSSALLLSPDQSAQLRDNLRLRIMTAQLALMMHQPEVWKSETQVLLQALQARFDVKSADGQRALRLAQQLADTSIQVNVPTVNNTLHTLDALRQASVRSAEQKTSPSSMADPAAEQPLPNAATQVAPEAVAQDAIQAPPSENAPNPATDPAVIRPEAALPSSSDNAKAADHPPAASQE